MSSDDASTRGRAAELRAYRALADGKHDETALAEATALAERAEDPLVRALARCEEARRARRLGLQQRAVIAGAELVAVVPGLVAGAAADERALVAELRDGLAMAVYAALDVPDVPFAAIDALIDTYAEALRLLGHADHAATWLRLRRHAVSGDDEAVARLTDALLPHINFTNWQKQLLGCPGCKLDSLAWVLGPEAPVEVIEDLLAPVLTGVYTFPNEDPAVARSMRNSTWRCNSASTSHLYLARAQLWHGRVAEADECSEQCRSEDLDPCFLLPTIFFLEVAMARRDEPRIRGRIDLLRPRLAAHEDVQEAMLGAVRVAQALAQIAAGTAAERADLWAFARAAAARLDARLERPRHLAFVAREQAAGPPFMRGPA